MSMMLHSNSLTALPPYIAESEFWIGGVLSRAGNPRTEADILSETTEIQETILNEA